MKRFLDIVLSLFLLVLMMIPMYLVSIWIKIISPGPIIYWSNRVGRYNRVFRMPKFRTMELSAPVVATHLLENPTNYLIPGGSFLRNLSLDELPQLWCILIGEMSFVGPRPALFNQDDLILLRTQAGVHCLSPGLTGWAQVNGRDELSIPVKVQYDAEYLNKISFLFDSKILFYTLIKVLNKEGISH